MYTPYVFSHDEMNRIMDAIDKSELKRFCPKSCLICMPCLFRLLYSTGMRISEALSIKNGDVNIATDTILLTKTKNGKERLIPLNPELKAVLTQYMRYRDKMPVKVSGIRKSPFCIRNRETVHNNDTLYLLQKNTSAMWDTSQRKESGTQSA